MRKVDLVKKTFFEVYVYSLYVLVIAILASVTFNYQYLSHQAFILILVLVLATLRLVPVLPLKRHKKYGKLIANDERIDIEQDRREVSYEISSLIDLKIKLAGYDGQPMYKHMDHLPARNMAMKRLLNGLGNYIVFSYRMNRYNLELYFETENSYEEFKKLTSQWKEKFPNINLTIMR